ncbi:hypothetical protein [Winogradskyella alexanderae]|uniref:Uncharacterized protein n=1 Tax=Winogradskyella alexanderae TaxID=2877123 RepID=A0ABS7XWG4_9FLAO|nr:hypothetical protein [Winogradskyella alexanderae]MCA0133734.1 hypothetical protein [Winogradskyella alexanderae]
MYRFLAILAFYKPFVVWSFVVNAIIGFINPVLIPAIVTKLFLTVFAWYYVSETPNRRKLTFYKNMGISPFKLFTFVFILDCIITIIFLLVFREFT